MNEQLFSDDEDANVVRLTINEHYAKAFEYKKEREELERRECSYTFLQASSTIIFFEKN